MFSSPNHHQPSLVSSSPNAKPIGSGHVNVATPAKPNSCSTRVSSANSQSSIRLNGEVCPLVDVETDIQSFARNLKLSGNFLSLLFCQTCVRVILNFSLR